MNDKNGGKVYPSAFSHRPDVRRFDCKAFEGSHNYIDYSSATKIILCSKNDVDAHGNDFLQKVVIEGNNGEEILGVLEKIKNEIGKKTVEKEILEPTQEDLGRIVSVEYYEPSAIVLNAPF